MAEGALFISDDLSVVVPDKHSGRWSLVTGRPGIRLYPTLGHWFFGDSPVALADDPRAKVIATPTHYTGELLCPLRHVVFLDGTADPKTEIEKFSQLRKNLFRPNWLAKLPTNTALKVAVRDISASAPITIEPIIGETNERALRNRATAIIETVRSSG